MVILREAKFGTYDAIGQGGAQGSGEYSPFWRGGKVLSPKRERKIREQRKFCNRCEKDLLDVDMWMWCIHHIDRDQSNNIEENFELLCRRCHALEHDCYSHLEPATTITYTQASGSGELQQNNAVDDIV